ncbi:MAG TPA: PadR family transcriptional regulator [Tepidisphaeraceae bacterium]|jgi:PadR family transcriptional regulator PadR|nr:PadR family transcriptional regulator [Tepidisphaeraceae bacterium]
MSSRRDLSFINGVPELLILRLLSRREMYGYELVSAIRVATGDVISVGEGCVYPILHTMEKNRLLGCRRVQKDGRGRLYYRLTEKGRKRLNQTSSHWQRISQAINSVLGDNDAAIART